MDFYHTIVTLPVKTNIPRDAIVNTFSWAPPVGKNQGTQLSDIQTAIGALYAGLKQSGVLSPAMAGTLTGKTYGVDLQSGHLGVPLGTFAASFGAPAGTPLPSELAIVASFTGFTGLAEVDPTLTAHPTTEEAQDEGAPATYLTFSRPESSQRGRIYVGALSANALLQDPNGQCIVDPTTTAAIASRMTDLLVAPASLAIWSRKNKNMNRATVGFVDNAFDVQRRRGVRATSRSKYPLV